jgi:hypothetical protein
MKCFPSTPFYCFLYWKCMVFCFNVGNTSSMCTYSKVFLHMDAPACCRFSCMSESWPWCTLVLQLMLIAEHNLVPKECTSLSLTQSYFVA